MIKRIQNAKEGDVFEVKLANDKRGFFQYVGLDQSQLNSEVIRVFKKRVDQDYEVRISELVQSDIDFYVHTAIKPGIKMGFWVKIDNAPIDQNFITPKFRCSNDFGNPKIEVSHRWYVWKMNEKYKKEKVLSDEQKKYDLGEVFPPVIVVEQMDNDGVYPYGYPAYE